MRLLSFRSSAIVLFICFYTTNGSAIFKWPNPQLDFIDEALYTQNKRLSFLTQDCSERSDTTVAAQWIRLAYHDMSTHDVSDGSGGLDASMLFEMDRSQNVGQGMAASFNDFNFFTSPYVGLADIIAMGTVFAVASCGGPVIPYRGGRIDATVAGPATVPEPHQDLQTHIDAFKRQGFNQSEMISLVACGHTLGGVRGLDFPTIVDNSKTEFADFDSTLFKFDNASVNEYLAGTTTNPLITTPNVTTRSDLRIFSSDGNVTMQSIASSEDFSKTCKNLFERMINTVPKAVKLTEPIDPIENKVNGVSLYTNAGNYILRATLRRLVINPNRKITLFWKERHQSSLAICPPAGCPVDVTSTSTPVPNYLGSLHGITALSTYTFSARIPLNSSISNFWFIVNEGNGSEPEVINNLGSNYNISQDTVLFYPTRTTIFSIGFNSVFALVVGVRTVDFLGADVPKISIESYQPGTENFLPIVETVELQLDSNNLPADGYTFFTGNVSTSVRSIHVDAIVRGERYRFFVDSDNFSVPQ